MENQPPFLRMRNFILEGIRRIPVLFYYLAILLLLIFVIVKSCSKSQLEYNGYAEAELIYLSSPYGGFLESLNILRGNAISQNQLAFKLSGEPESSDLAQAKKNLEQAQANLLNLIEPQRETIQQGIEAQISQANALLALYAVRLSRSKNLYTKGMIDKDAVDAAQSNYDAQIGLIHQYTANLQESKLGSRDEQIKAALAAKEAAMSQVDKYEWILKNKSIFSPFNGIIYDTYYNVGEWVAANNAVASLYAAKYLYVTFYIPAPKLSWITLNDTVTVKCEGCERSYSAKIVYISPQAEYMPPVVYTRENSDKLVYRIRANPEREAFGKLHPGQPVYIYLKKHVPHGK